MKSVLALLLSISAISVLAAASGRVGNGILPSLEYQCLPGESIYRWCEEFEESRRVTAEDFQEGANLAVGFEVSADARVRASGILVLRDGNSLRYLIDEQGASPEECEHWLWDHAGEARPLEVNSIFGELMDDQVLGEGQTRTILRVPERARGRLDVRIEIKRSGSREFSEKNYLSFPILTTTPR